MTSFETRVSVPGGDVVVHDHAGTGPDVLCAHGLAYTLDTWEPVARLLEGRARVVTVDLRGHGQSSADIHTVEEVWEDLHAVIAELGLNRPVLIGHDFGAYFVTGGQVADPSLGRALLLVDGPVALPRAEAQEWLETLASDELLGSVTERFALGGTGTGESEREAFIDHVVAYGGQDWITRETGPVTLRRGVARSILTRPDGSWTRRPTPREIAAMTRVDPALPYFPSVEIYERIDVPTWFVQPQGGLNADALPRLREVVAHREGFRLLEVPGGHHVEETDPGLIASIIAELLDEIRA